MKRLLLVRHASTDATRDSAFPGEDDVLDEAGRAAAAAAGLPERWDVVSSPARRCLETAAAAGLREPLVEPAIAECDFGAWSGRSLASVHADEPAAARAWMTAPDAAPHGGESLRTFAARVAAWLDAQAATDGRVIAITHGGVVKAAVVHALGAPLDAFWRIDAAPLCASELHAHDGHWTVSRINAPAASAVAVEATA